MTLAVSVLVDTLVRIHFKLTSAFINCRAWFLSLISNNLGATHAALSAGN